MDATVASTRRGKLWGEHLLQIYGNSMVAGVESEVLNRRTIFTLMLRGGY